MPKLERTYIVLNNLTKKFPGLGLGDVPVGTRLRITAEWGELENDWTPEDVATHCHEHLDGAWQKLSTSKYACEKTAELEREACAEIVRAAAERCRHEVNNRYAEATLNQVLEEITSRTNDTAGYPRLSSVDLPEDV